MEEFGALKDHPKKITKKITPPQRSLPSKGKNAYMHFWSKNGFLHHSKELETLRLVVEMLFLSKVKILKYFQKCVSWKRIRQKILTFASGRNAYVDRKQSITHTFMKTKSPRMAKTHTFVKKGRMLFCHQVAVIRLGRMRFCHRYLTYTLLKGMQLPHKLRKIIISLSLSDIE